MLDKCYIYTIFVSRLHTQTIGDTAMKTRKLKITEPKARQIAASHNCVSLEVVANYTVSELKEILRHLNINATII